MRVYKKKKMYMMYMNVCVCVLFLYVCIVSRGNVGGGKRVTECIPILGT